jgi:conjugative relaxase-like TrwC/TraI family protein
MGVSLRKISGRPEEIDYPWKEVEQARAHDEYLRENGRSNVSWIGDAGERGFEGTPTREDARLLLTGQTADGERLVPEAVIEAFDLTFGLQKDISTLHAVGGPEVRVRITRVRERSLNRTIDKLEQHMLYVRIGSGRREMEREVAKATGLAGIRYEHSRSRALDPQLHDHVLISTVVNGPDGQLRRMWIRDLGELRRTLGYWHEAIIREEMSREFPGIEWEAVQENGTAHIAQFPSSLREAMSTRSRNIKEEVASWERETGRRANSAVKQLITLQTRPPKPDVPNDAKWTEDMIAIAHEHGFTQQFIRDEILNKSPLEQGKIAAPSEVADRLLGPDGLTATRTKFRDTDVMVGVIQAGVPACKVEEYVKATLADERVIAIETLKGTSYVTEDLRRAELSIERCVIDGVDAAPHLAATREDALQSMDSVDLDLNEGQRQVVFAAATSRDQVVLIEAGAGTGKTTTAGVIRGALEMRGLGVRGAAPTGKAAVELAAGAGIATRTVDSLLWEIDRGGTLSDGGSYQVLIVDEAAMLDTRKFARVCAQVQRERMKLIVMGDSNQLTSIEPGGWLGYFTRSGLRPALKLDEIVRQRDPAHRKAVSDLSRGRPGTWIKYQTDRGNVMHLGAGQPHQAGARAAALLTEAADRHGWNHVLAITPTNMRREVINEHVQQARLERDELGPLLAESNEHELFHVGDRVMFFGPNDRARNLQNGLIGTVLADTEQGGLVISLNESRTELRTLTAKSVAESLRLAYAVTDYKGQGVTVHETVMVAAAEELDLNRGYVAASRAREQTRLILISDNTMEETLKALSRHLRIREDDALAIEHIESATGPGPKQRHQVEWLSEHRERINQLGREQEALGPVAGHTDRRQLDNQLAALSDRRREIAAEQRADFGLPGARGRRDREQARNKARDGIKDQEARLRADRSALTERASAAFDAWSHARHERDELVALAAQQEWEPVDGKRAPWVEVALGPEPPTGQQGLWQRWERVGQHIASLRVDRGITDPTETGIYASDTMLTNDLRSLRERIQSARELGPDAKPVALMESRKYVPGRLELARFGSRELGHGIGD